MGTSERSADETTQVAIRVLPALLERADALIPQVQEERGYTVTRAEVLREAMTLGLAQLERRGAKATK